MSDIYVFKDLTRSKKKEGGSPSTITFLLLTCSMPTQLLHINTYRLCVPGQACSCWLYWCCTLLMIYSFSTGDQCKLWQNRRRSSVQWESEPKHPVDFIEHVLTVLLSFRELHLPRWRWLLPCLSQVLFCGGETHYWQGGTNSCCLAGRKETSKQKRHNRPKGGHCEVLKLDFSLFIGAFKFTGLHKYLKIQYTLKHYNTVFKLVFNGHLSICKHFL